MFASITLSGLLLVGLAGGQCPTGNCPLARPGPLPTGYPAVGEIRVQGELQVDRPARCPSAGPYCLPSRGPSQYTCGDGQGGMRMVEIVPLPRLGLVVERITTIYPLVQPRVMPYEPARNGLAGYCPECRQSLRLDWASYSGQCGPCRPGPGSIGVAR
jgi:hypothetical protein